MRCVLHTLKGLCREIEIQGFSPPTTKNNVKPIPYLTRLIKMDQVDGFELMTAAHLASNS